MQQLGFSIILFPIDQPCLFKGDLGGFQPKPEQLTHDWLLTEPYWIDSRVPSLSVRIGTSAIDSVLLMKHQVSIEFQSLIGFEVDFDDRKLNPMGSRSDLK
jgi:hypothetical protein